MKLEMRGYRYKIAVVFLSAALGGCAGTGEVRSFRSDKSISKEDAVITMAKAPTFFTKKRVVYLMAWNGIPVGRIIAEIGEKKKYKEYEVYEMVLKTESNEFLSKIYRVEDVYSSYVDAKDLTSRRFEADRKEGNYRKHLVVEYDFAGKKAIYTNLTDGSVKQCDIKEDVQDPLSAMCHFMTLPVHLGKKMNMTVNLNEKNYDLYGQVESLDVIRLPELGSFPAFKIRPYALLGGEEVKKGKGYIYFMAGKERYPLYGVVQIPFGKVTATLTEVNDI
jgi:hypothetical protein